MAGNFFSGFLALGTGASTAFVEMTGAGYARQAVTFGPVSGAVTVSQGGLTFAAGAPWTASTQYGLYDASGNLIFWWNRTDPAAVASAATFTLPAGALSLAMPDLMSAPPTASLVFAPGSAVGTANNGNPVFSGVAIQISAGQVGAL